MDRAGLENFFDNYEKESKRETKPWGFERFDRLRKENPEKVDELVTAINTITSLTFTQGNGGPFEIDLFRMPQSMYAVLPYLAELHELDLISFPQLRVVKENIDYFLEEGSSGEINAFASLIALFSTIDSGSLVLMDEPETSLHPNWQMQYINLLNGLLPELYSAHFVVCSHSHFLVSDLPTHKSQIISMENKNGIQAEALSQDTYGWSAENILYRIFRLKTSRNYYMQSQLSLLLSLISKNSKDSGKIRDLTQELSTVNISENDPLKPILAEAEEYLKNL